MSESISTSSPRSGPTFAEGSAERFAGADDIWRAWYDGLAPDPLLSVSEWSEKHRMLAARASAEPGRYRIARTPYMRAIMDALSPADPARRIVFMKAAQVGATEGANNFIGFVIHQAPGPMLAVQPTVELAKRNSRQRIDPLIEESAALRSLVRPARSRDSGNTMLSKEFAGGILIMTGANSAVGLRSIPARYILLDEVDAYPASADEEGDPVTLAEARSLTFAHRRKVLLISTPTVKGFSRIEREYEASDQRRYFVPCPHCGHAQVLVFERLKWDKGKPETAAYHCASCETPIAEHHKTAMLAAGKFGGRRERCGRPEHHRVPPVGALLAGRLAFVGGHRARLGGGTGLDESIRAFRNTILGETWVESGEAPDWQRLYDRRERWPAGTVPAGGLFLTAGADIQKDRIEVDVWAWGRGLESWLIDHIVIEGGPERTEPWAALDRLLSQVWPHEGGTALGLAKLAIDTGYEPTAVYGWARRAGVAQVAPVKGADGFNRSSPVSGPTYVDASDGGRRLRRGARLWTVAVSTFKAETYRFLRLERPTDEERAEGKPYPPGSVHLPHWVEDEWLKQFVAEQLVTVRTRRGFARLEWQKLRERNEALDCRVYARAAAWIAGADRFPERRWRRMEAALANEPRFPNGPARRTRRRRIPAPARRGAGA